MFYYLIGTVRYEFKTKDNKDAWLWFSFKKAVSNRNFHGGALQAEIHKYIQEMMTAKAINTWIKHNGEFNYGRILGDIHQHFNLKSISLDVWDQELGLMIEK